MMEIDWFHNSIRLNHLPEGVITASIQPVEDDSLNVGDSCVPDLT